jgi:hypothetical protein
MWQRETIICKSRSGPCDEILSPTNSPLVLNESKPAKINEGPTVFAENLS